MVESARFVLLAAIGPTSDVDLIVASAARFAQMILGSELHLVYVTDPILEADTSPELRSSAMARHHEDLERWARAAHSRSGVPVVGHVGEGDPANAILDMAGSLDADLVLVGTRDRTGAKRWVLGSVAQTVARRAGCPVLVVRPKEHPGAVPEIEPPCPMCMKVQLESRGAIAWCARHSQHHPHAHLHYAMPASFGGGSSLILG